jgi:hypothetical protein
VIGEDPDFSYQRHQRNQRQRFVFAVGFGFGQLPIANCQLLFISGKVFLV